ncbi:MAG: efflux RND transporter permease subunit [Myxococcota bacterium]
MNLTEWAHKNWAVTTLGTGLLMFSGLVSYFTLPAQEDPAILVRDAVITTRYPGMPAERVERLITKRIEEEVRKIPELKEVRSVSMPGVSTVHAVVDDVYFELDQIWDQVRKKVNAAVPDLPQGTQTPVINDDFGDVAIMTFALRSDGFTMSEMADTSKFIHDTIYGLEGTKRVDILGTQEETIFVETENAKLKKLGLTPSMIGQTLASQNVLRPGGEIDTGDRQFVIQPSGAYESIDEVKNTLIRSPATGDLIPLQDVAAVHRGYQDPPSRTAFYNGDSAIVFSVSMLPGFRALDYCKVLEAKLDELRQTLPLGYRLDIITNQAVAVAGAVYGVSINVLQTLAIVLAVVILFLGLRTGLIVGSIVPGVMLISLAVMGVSGIVLQRMSLATLVIALGLLVDNAIVIAEDFKRRLMDGESREDALRNGGKSLALPLLSSTATTVLVFLPLMLAPSTSGEFTRSISIVILISLSVSWLLSMMVTPSLCYRFIPDPAPDSDGKMTSSFSDRIFQPLDRLYRTTLTWTLDHRGLFVVAMVLLFISAQVAMAINPIKFFPDSDRTEILVYVDLPPDASSRVTNRVVQEMTEHIADKETYPDVVDVVGYAGFGGPRFVLSLTPFDPTPNRGFLTVNVDELGHMARTTQKLTEEVNKRFPEARARIRKMYYGPSDSNIITVQAKGPDADVLLETSEKIADIFQSVPSMVDIYSDWETKVVRFDVDVDQEMARRSGVSTLNVSNSLDTFFTGSVVSEYREEDDLFPIVTRAKAAERNDVRSLQALTIDPGGNNDTVPLFQVADVKLVPEFSRLAREDLSRTVTVEARNLEKTAEDLVAVLDPKLEELKASLPPGHSIEYDGVVQESKDSQASLGVYFPLCMGLMLVLLVAQFNSFLRPAMVFLTMPLVIIGAAWGLFFFQADFGFMVILGLLSLMGIIVNNGIVLIDRIDIELAEGKSVHDAVIDASVRRLRPILMTTITTILGFLPLLVFTDALFYPMASAMAMGLLIGTILTLGLVPVLYRTWIKAPPPESSPEDVPTAAAVA